MRRCIFLDMSAYNPNYIQSAPKVIERDDTTRHTAEITNVSVIAAVEMNFRKKTPPDQFWAFYMEPRHKAEFSNSVKAFEDACRNRVQFLKQGVR